MGSDKSEVKQLVLEAENNDTTIWTITRRYIEDYLIKYTLS